MKSKTLGEKMRNEFTLPPQLDFNYELFLDRSTMLYGGSDTGKTTVIFDILNCLKGHIKQITVVCPTDRENKSYSGNNIPTPVIHDKLTDELLADIWERQVAMKTTYTKAHDPAILERLFYRLNLPKEKTILDAARRGKSASIEAARSQYAQDESMQKKKIKEIEKEFSQFFLDMCKVKIVEHHRTLEKMDLSEDERYTLRYIGFNPRELIIFDDCTEEFKNLGKKGKNILEKMCYRGRWAWLTFIIAAHDDKALPSELRKNIFVSFFCNNVSAMTYFDRKTNGFSREVHKKITSWINDKKLFKQNNEYQKLVYIRKLDEFYVYTAKIHDNFKFLSDFMYRFYDKIASSDMTIDPSNRFIHAFK